MNSLGWIGVDLDGTLAVYDGFKGPLHIGPPVPLMLERVKRWLARGRDVRIFTARVSPTSVERNRGPSLAEVRGAIEDWCREHIGQALPVTCEKDFMMVELWDDRCVQVIPNRGIRVPTGEENWA